MIKTGKELAAACEAVANNYKTLYVNGCFGAPMTDSNKDRYTQNTAYNKKAERTAKIRAASADTFGFDCVCFIKGLLWGWEGDGKKTYGGAVYASRGVPDMGEDRMIESCDGVSTDFDRIAVGEVVWMPGHIGVYLGGGLVAEATPAWEDGVQITAVHNLGKQAGYHGRTWKKHGRLPWLTYEDAPKSGFPLTLRLLKTGAKGEDVKALQLLLMGRGYTCGSWGADGDFGSATAQAVKNFQKDRDLEQDGIAGAETFGALLGVNA